jgi:hypothetical protein
MSDQVEVGRGVGNLWSTRYPVSLPGAADTEITVRHGFAGGLTVYVDGLRAERGAQRGVFLISQVSGRQSEVTVRADKWGTAPVMVVDGETTPIGRPIEGAEWLWVGLPLLFGAYLLYSSGSFGGFAIAGLLSFANVRIFVDDGFTPRNRYLFSLASMGTFAAFGAVAAAAIAVLLL